MFWSYLISAFRSAVQQKLYTFINLAGLTVALTCVTLIALYVKSEATFDRWIPGNASVYRVEILAHPPGQKSMHFTQSPLTLGPIMKAELPEVVGQTRIMPQKSTVNVGDMQFPEQIDIVDPDFFQVIQLPLVEGDAAGVLRNPDSVVISQSLARKFFGDADPVGRTLTFEGQYVLTVSGVVRDLPYNTSIVGDIFVPYESQINHMPRTTAQSWFSFPGWTYVRLAPGADSHRVQEKILGLFVRHVPPRQALQMKTMLHASFDTFINASLVPLRDVHLTTDQFGGMKPAGSRTTVYGGAAIALLILLIACFNYTNLATARAMMRAREVGLRKTLGARRRQLVVQFLSESVAFGLIALVLALAITEILLPAYGGFLGRDTTFRYIDNWPLCAGLFAIAVAAGLLGGIYPALVLSGFRPTAAFKPAFTGQSGSGLLRTGLVTLQFAISIGLGVAAAVMFSQIRHARHVDLGFNRDNIVIIANSQALPPSTTKSFIEALKASPYVAGVARSSTIPFSDELGDFAILSMPGSQQRFTASRVSMSPAFTSVYRMKLIAGRFLSRERATDITREGDPSNNSNVIIDDNAARALGLSPESAIGKAIVFSNTRATVAGVVQSALFHGARSDAMMPCLYYFNPDYVRVLSIRVKGGHIPEAVAFIDATWHRFAPNAAIQRHFLNDSFDKFYTADEKEGAIIGLFVSIAIFLACLGLFGLAAFAVERRTKEIGIRKVMGAKTKDIVRLLLWQFSVPVLVANLIAWPVAWYYLRHWLDGYAYRIDLNLFYFVAAGAVALVIAWLTVIGHAVRVARANPVHALRYE